MRLFVIVACFSCVHLSEGSSHASRQQMSELSKFWSTIDSLYQQTDDFWEKVATNVSQVMRRESKTVADGNCYRAIEATFRNGVQKEWSAKMITANSFSKRSLIGGLVAEEYSNLGDFDDCLGVLATEKDMRFEGKYCLASLKTPTLDYYTSTVENQVLANFSATNYVQQLARQWLVIRNRFPYVQGLCVPSICSEEQIGRLLQRYLASRGYIDGLNVTVGYCQQRGEPFAPKKGFLVAVHIISLVFILALFGTLINLKYLNSWIAYLPFLPTIREHLSYFDLMRNFKSLFVAKGSEKSSNEYDLRFIHGLKAILIAIMCIGHAFCYLNVSMALPIAPFRKYPSNMADFLHFDLLSAFWEKIILMISVFFIISGFLTMYLTAKKVAQRANGHGRGVNGESAHCSRRPSPPPLLSWVGLRWLTLLPSMGGTICLTIVAQYAGSGPLFHEQITDSYVDACHTHWWTHVLFINNFWPADQMCGINLWFIAASFQLHIALYLVVYLYFRCRGKTAAFVAAAALAAVTCFLLVLFYSGVVGVPLIKSVVGFRFPFPVRAISLVYMLPLLHFLPYFLGVIVALCLLEYQFNAISAKLHILYTALWGIFVLSLTALHLPAMTEENEQSHFFYNGSTFLIFSVIVFLNTGWFFSNITASASSLVRAGLSLNIWVPFSRLSYGIYLLNPLLIWYNVHLNRDTPTLSIVNSATFSISIYLQSLVLATVLFLVFEAPFSALVGDLTRGGGSRGHQKVSSVGEAVKKADLLSLEVNNNVEKNQHPA